ncbi:MAG: hypothetical protein GY760_04440 [Deltaproteobacteria bacterium]|nr:hypothetical protein [Deltaproteobacteria bacterium]
MIRAILVIILTTALTFVATNGMKLEEDIISSLVESDKTRKAVFDNYQKSSFFSSRVYVEIPSGSKIDINLLDKIFTDNRYKRVPFIDHQKFNKIPLNVITSLTSKDDLEKILTDERVEQSFETIKKYINLPGSSGLVENYLIDPFSLKRETFSKFKGVKTNNRSNIVVFERVGALHFESVGKVYDYLMDQKEITFLGSDFFAYENYRSVRDDIPFCLWISIPLNLLIFGLLCRNYYLILFLIVGTFVSYASGLSVVRIFYPSFYAIVLAFTSTFVGFNNEYLIHLSGIGKKDRLKSLVGLGSAIGTTLIGFIILLFGKSIILKQIALVSIGGMVGFIIFLLIYQDHLSKVQYRTFNIQKFQIKPGVMATFWVGVIIFFLMVPIPSMKTNIKDFQFNSSTLQKNADIFSKKLEAMSLGHIYSVKIENEPLMTFEMLKKEKLTKGFHPLKFYKTIETQKKTIKYLNKEYPEMLEKLSKKLVKIGINPDYLSSKWVNELKPMTGFDYLSLCNEVSTLPWFFKHGQDSYLYYPSNNMIENQGIDKGYPVNPKFYYDTLLTSIQNNIFNLFMIGLVIMMLYIIPLQRKIMKIAYIFAPLAVSLMILTLYFNYIGQNINFIHIVGLSLVIAVALDYPALAVSSNFGKSEQSKILLTGLSTIFSFGVLVLAQHPVLKHLGLVVVIGATSSLITCLFTNIPQE